jgi:mono/diheme cytochrome c family protein
MRSRIAWTILVLAVVLIVITLMRFNLTALPEPGHFETRVANLAKRFVIRRASRQRVPARPVDTKASVDRGGTHYGLDCSICHADDGRAQRSPGQWMYPRASDLTSKQVQSYSDQELFWIIQNGIRFTGMPAFGDVETPDHIWDLVNYVRTLPSQLRSENSTRDSDSPRRGRDDPAQEHGLARR